MRSQTWWAALLFVLPWVVVYELGTWYFTYDPAAQTEQRIVAFSLLRDSLAALGASARWVAPASVISILLGLSLLHRERRGLPLTTIVGMHVESMALALPILLLGMAIVRLPLANAVTPEPLGEAVILSIGAGVYEELVFRLIAMTALHFFFVDFLLMRSHWATPLTIVISALIFSLYHYWGPEQFSPQTFVFRTLAGLYFGGVMISRGFGVTVGSHAGYDICIVLLRST